MSMIDHVVFDIGGVLIHWDPDLPYRSLIPDKAARTRFLAEICSPDWNLEQDRGRPWEEAEDTLIARHPEHAELIRAYRARWGEMIPFAHDETVAVLTRLVAHGRDVTLLTNFAADTFEEASRRYPFLTTTRGATVSGRIGKLKPDREIFDHHRDHFDLDPGATLFIDDKPENVEGARQAGWRGLHYTDGTELAAELTALRLL